jgi:hypothetical protein
MGTIRKKINDSWVPIASNQATEIGVKSPNLLPDGVKETNVEAVLNNFQGDIKTLKGNVAWLAKHGGGGSGSGSGGSFDTNNKIVVNNLDSGSEITLKDYATIQIQASDSSSKWNVTIRVENENIKTTSGITPSNKVTLSKSEIEKAGITKSTVTISITATNTSTLQNIYWTGIAYIATASISIGNFSYDFADFADKIISYEYSVGLLGRYNLVINNVVVVPGVELTTNTGEIDVNVKDLYEKLELSVGSNTLVAYLVNSEQSDIKSELFTSYLTIVTDVPVIQCTELSSDKNNPTAIYMNKGTTIVQVPYTVYFNGVSYKVKIYSSFDNLTPGDIDFESISTYNSYNTLYANGSYKLETEEYDTPFEITIALQDQSSGLPVYSQTFYCITRKAEYDILDNGCSKSLMFDYVAYNGIIQDRHWADTQNGYETELSIVNPNSYSESIDTTNKMLRLQNTSHAVITNKSDQTFYNKLKAKANPAFTLSISFKADFHPDDERTVFQFANLYGSDQNYTPQEGILIRDHELFIGPNTMSLEDDHINNITITYSILTGETFGNAFVYVDGTPEAVFKIKPSDIIPTTSDIYLGCSYYKNEPMFFCDTNIYRVTLYDTCLNPFQILYDYLNTQAYIHPVNGMLDSSYIEEGLNRNFVSTAEDGTRTSLLWSMTNSFNNNNSDFSDCFNVSNLVGGNPVSLKDTLNNYNIPIPIMLIDVSSSSAWTWQNFITPNSGLNKVTGCRFQYLDQTQSNNSIITGYVDVEVQGTSTLADFIKNLNLSFADNTVFLPNKYWFPETTYTAKADIVDSSHSLNASIGKFVNNELGLQYNEDGSLKSTDSWYPYSETVLETFVEQKTKKDSAIQKHFPHATLKHGVEGFPVFIIMQFADGKTATLGIYQFILGRNSPRNLGYEVISGVTGMPDASDITYPYYNDNVEIKTTDVKGYWIEMTENNSFGINDDFQGLDEDSFKQAKLTGAFWQTDGIKESTSDYDHGIYYDRVCDIKYNNLGQDAVSSLYDFAPFAKFVQAVQQLPVTNRRYSKSGSKYLNRNSFSNIDYPKYTFREMGTTVDWKLVEGEYNHLSITGDPLNGILQDLNIDSISKAFVVFMLFGLLDNFQKNLPLKFYQRKDKTWENALIGIYDTDSGCGGTNEADLKVAVYMWLCYLANVNNQFIETSEGSEDDVVSHIIGNSNKLWFLDTQQLNYSMEQGWSNEGSIYTSQWYSLINKLGLSKLTELVDLYIDKYFLPQTEGCGEILFNLTYFTKYLNKYEQNGVAVNQYSKLHGRRIAQVTSWLTQRVKFLDSMFTAMGSTMPNAEQTVLGGTVNLSTGSAPEFSITTNYPMVVAVDSQGSNNQFVFAAKNTDTPVYWGSSSVTAQQVSHTISYPEALQKLGNDSYKLSDIYYQKISGGSIPYLTTFDVSNCAKIESLGADGMDSFKKDKKSELRIINAENTNKANTTGFNFILNLREGFEKMQELKIKNSCVTQIELPTSPSIPMSVIEIVGSQLTTLTLDSQNLIETLDLTNCAKLKDFTLLNCDKFKTLNIDRSQSSLKTISISSDNFEYLTCEDNQVIEEIVINSNGLKVVVVNNCPMLKRVVVTGTNLERLSLTNCNNLYTLEMNKTNSILETLDLSGTKIKYIEYGTGQDPNIMDLSPFTAIENLNLNNNSELEYVQFKNDATPFVVNSLFNSCNNLKRIYGHVAIHLPNSFSSCKQFSLFGTDPSQVTFYGYSTYDTRRTKHPTEIAGIINGGKIVVQYPGKMGYSNYWFTGEDLTECFSGTACTAWDAYYALYNLDTTVTSIKGMFKSLVNKCFEGVNLDNNPHYNTFVKCGNVQYVDYLFYDSTANIKLPSPEYEQTDDGGITVTKDNGLFSPMTKCEDFYCMFNNIFWCDRAIFRRKEGTYAIKYLQHFSPRYILGNVQEFTNGFLSTSDSTVQGSANIIKASNPNIGNLNGFFTDMPKLTRILNSLNTRYIDYEKSGTFIPDQVTEITGSFRTRLAKGEIRWNLMFSNPSIVNTISGCCAVSEGYEDFDCYYYLSNSTFEGLTSLKYYKRDDTYGGGLNVNGSGVNREIPGTIFPYSILTPCRQTIIICDGLFANIAQNDNLEEAEFPGTIFIGTPNITHVRSFFAYYKMPYHMSSDGFRNCPKLTEVAAMFASASSGNCKLVGGIPARLFFHGYQTERTVTYEYLNPDYPIDPTVPTVVNGEEVYPTIPSDQIKKLTYTVKTPRANITYINGCFQGINATAYVNAEPTCEQNPDYRPFKFYRMNGVWLKADPDYAQFLYAWEYDGVNKPYDAIANPDLYKGFDDEFDSSAAVSKFIDTIEVQNNLNFCTPPDLFRYCNSSQCTDLSSMFKDTTKAYNTMGVYDPSNYSKLGLKGRICPYLLKPVAGVTTIASMFESCSALSCYNDGSYDFYIPRSFFAYTPQLVTLTSAFANQVFSHRVSFDVFSAGANNKQALVIDKMFWKSLYGTSDTEVATIGAIFKGIYINSLADCFKAIEGTDLSVEGNLLSNQYIVFDTVFEKSKIVSGKDTGVFAGYTNGMVTFRNPQLRTDETAGNYKYRDNTYPSFSL